MREIKFRAWNKLANQMIYDIQEDKEHNQKIITSFGFMLKKNNYEIMQFTGLYDKNNTPIYEGDLLKIYFDINEIDDYIFFSLNDEEKENGYYIKKISIPEFYAEPISDDFEVIGNIYDDEVEE